MGAKREAPLRHRRERAAVWVGEACDGANLITKAAGDDLYLAAEAVALRYYRALRDGIGEPLVSQGAAHTLADEQRHVSFHCHRLKIAFQGSGPSRRAAVFGAWRILGSASPSLSPPITEPR
ncbi:hypothetical protein [Amycolatopsis sp. Hca4]|uniref:hypothetical protein n=1 Tax=Amycolatopsis sp. Hca4 TaxID=2742131 RepID=UPI0020CB5CBF|nr:hypothetical protein [Amycolatopsis sp. Hca4]